MNILDKSKKIAEVYQKIRSTNHDLNILNKFKSFDTDCNLNMASSSESAFFTGIHKKLLIKAMINETERYIKTLENELSDILTNK